MKKLLAGICSILFLNSFSQVSTDQAEGAEKAAGQKVLIKAISVIVNTEANKKAPVKTVTIFSSDCP